MPEIRILDRALTRRPFHGIGVEADAFIYDDTNRSFGVQDEDLQLVERRLRAVRPAVARLFVGAGWFNPSLDGCTFDWSRPEYAHLTRQLRLLAELGTRVNLVLFEPMPPRIADPSPLVRAMAALIERLDGSEGIDCVRWLTLYNEPDSMYPHDSPLSRAVFGEERLRRQPPFEAYVRLNREAWSLMRERGLYPHVRLVVADTVWGHPMRMERLRLCREAFGDLDVDYSFHSYNPEWPAYYDGNPNFAYPGMREEARLMRDVLGDERSLMLWEFNNAGSGFGSHHPGVGPHGTDLLGSVETGVEVAEKVMALAGLGVGGFCLWCLHDMVYLANAKLGPMRFGLWRYRWEGWAPRPCYHYFAALCRAFRPGCAFLAAETGNASDVEVLAARLEGRFVAGLLNKTGAPREVALAAPFAGPFARSRVYPDILPRQGDLPVSEELEAPVVAGTLTLALAPHELTVLTAGANSAHRTGAVPRS